MRCWVTALTLSACSFSAELAPTAADDAPDPACADDWMFTPSNFDPCASDTAVQPALTIPAGDYTYDPASGDLATDPAGTLVANLPATGASPRILSLAGLTVEAGAHVRIIGDTPLVIAVHGDALVAGTLDVSARSATSGPGGATCAALPGSNALGDAQVPYAGGGGGAGGAFGTAGGAGGAGDATNGYPQSAGGLAMDPVGEALLVPLRGGCTGGAGGEEDPSCTSAATPGGGGGGGGALQLTVRDTLTLAATAQLAANGGGGGGGVNATYAGGPHVGVGGGGGGSGGGLLVEGAHLAIDANAILCANGGGGGGGSHNNDGPITGGGDGTCSLDVAPGGTGDAASGGTGAADATAAAAGDAGTRTDDGGGGGGGGAGRIRVRAILDPKPTAFRSSPAAVID